MALESLEDMKEGDFFRYERTGEHLYVWHGLGDHQTGEARLLWPDNRFLGPLFRNFEPEKMYKVSLCKACRDLAGRDKGMSCACWLKGT